MRKTVLPAALLFSACFAGVAEREPAETLHARRAPFASSVVLTGELDASRGDLLAVPQLPSWETTIKWIVDDGTHVRVGDRVVELDNSAFSSQLDTRREAERQRVEELQQRRAEWTADLEQRELDLEKRRAELEKAQLEAAVPKEVLSQREHEDRQIRLRRASVEHEKAVDLLLARRVAVQSDERNLLLRIDRARREIMEAETGIEALMLRAPRAGMAVARDNMREGRKLQAGDSVWVGLPVVMIPDLSSLRVLATLSDVDDGRIAVGQKATITLDGYPDRRYTGWVRSISAVARESRRQSLRREFQVDIGLDALDPSLMRPGLSARVEVHTARAADALLVPRAALRFEEKTPQVRLASGRLVTVKLGPCNAVECVVVDGLEEDADLRRVVELTNG